DDKKQFYDIINNYYHNYNNKLNEVLYYYYFNDQSSDNIKNDIIDFLKKDSNDDLIQLMINYYIDNNNHLEKIDINYINDKICSNIKEKYLFKYIMSNINYFINLSYHIRLNTENNKSNYFLFQEIDNLISDFNEEIIKKNKLYLSYLSMITNLSFEEIINKQKNIYDFLI